MKRIAVILVGILFAGVILAQTRYMTKTGYIGFYSHTPVEDIKADNNQVASILDSQTGEMVFNVLIKSFVFEKALMQEHFNENYMESDKFPKASFKGKVTNLDKIDFSKNGTQSVELSGEMTIHGVTKPFTTKGTLEIQTGKIIGKSKFSIKPEDYNITIPGVVREKIAKEMDVTVVMNYEPLAGK